MENIRDLVKKIKLLALHHLQSGKLLKDVTDIVLYDECAARQWIGRFVELYEVIDSWQAPIYYI